MGLPRQSRALMNGLTHLSLLKGSAGGLLGRELAWGYHATLVLTQTASLSFPYCKDLLEDSS